MPKLVGIHIVRAQKQHSSVVLVIPVLVRRSLGIKAGDYVVFNGHRNTGVVEITKFVPEGENHAGDKADSSREDQGGRTCAQDGG